MSMDGIIPYVLGGGGGGGGSSAATVAAMISGTENTATASQGYSVGEYFIYNDALYIVTSPISQGDTITPGTNCDTTTVCENLTDLNTAINGLATIISVSQLSDLSVSGSHFVQFAQHVNVGGIAFPQYSKGVLVATGTDATIYAIASDGNLYTAFRNGSTWLNGRCISYEVKTKILQPASAVPIPSSGSNSAWIALEGLTGNYVLIAWNFSTCAENSPPANLQWWTGSGANSGCFRIDNLGGTPPTGETCRPVFVIPN